MNGPATARLRLRPLNPRTIIVAILFIALVALLGYEIDYYAHNLMRLTASDYWTFFVPWGELFLEGHPNYRYPLPTQLYLFVPFVFLPAWFSLVWVIAPFGFVFYLFKRNGVLAWLFIPLLINVAQGQLEAWLIIPAYWAMTANAALAGISAALLTLKPQLAVFILPYLLCKWWREQNWHPIRQCAFTLAVLYLPTFIIDPLWPTKIMPELVARMNEPIMLTGNATLWSWWWHGSVTTLALVPVLCLTAFLSWRAAQVPANRAKVIFLLSLLVVPVYYAASYVTVLATLKNSKWDLVLIVAISWIGALPDVFLHGWGVAYALIPIAALWLLSRQAVEAESPPLPAPSPAAP